MIIYLYMKAMMLDSVDVEVHRSSIFHWIGSLQGFGQRHFTRVGSIKWSVPPYLT